MMSTKRSLQSVTLVLVVFTVFTVSLTETLQFADAEIEFVAGGAHKTFDIKVGETQMQTWELSNVKETGDISLEIYAIGEGSEFFLFENYVTLASKETKSVEIYLTIPDDHDDNVEYRTELKVLKRAPPLEKGVTGITINLQYTVPTKILIGDDPIYTAPEVEVKAELPTPPVVTEIPKEAEVEEETIEEKMARIKATNQERTIESPVKELQVDDTFEEEAVPELQVDDKFIPEPVSEINEVDDLSEKVECDFIAWFLSLFGIGKC